MNWCFAHQEAESEQKMIANEKGDLEFKFRLNQYFSPNNK
jgi:hypothetical protein